MSNRCSTSTCLNGNCPGCKNGVLFCEDPRCFPNCQDCNTNTASNSNWILITVILILLGILLLLAVVVGFGWFTDRKKAMEPKELTVNKHIHTVTPPPIIVSSPTPVVNVNPMSVQTYSQPSGI